MTINYTNSKNERNTKRKVLEQLYQYRTSRKVKKSMKA